MGFEKNTFQDHDLILTAESTFSFKKIKLDLYKANNTSRETDSNLTGLKDDYKLKIQGGVGF